jgi:MFS transporter, DHA1 family, inner membrane transport protein
MGNDVTFSALTGRFPRRGLILSLMGLFTATNLAAAVAPDYYTLLASRINFSFGTIAQ